MKSKHIVLSLVAFILSFTALAGRVSADTCTTQYGGTTTCVPTDLTINKQIAKPVVNEKGITVSEEFVENLGTDNAFAPGSEVHFKLIIKNASNETLDVVTVEDILPQFLTFVSGPGTYDATTRTLKFSLETMTPGEIRTVELVAKIASDAQTQANKQLFCVTNYADVRFANHFDEDTAQLCIGTSAPGNLPVAGFNDLLVILPAAGVALGGLVLLKKRG